MYDTSKMQDITAPEFVEIAIRDDGAVIWINVDGVTALRACRIKNLVLTDYRLGKAAAHDA